MFESLRRRSSCAVLLAASAFLASARPAGAEEAQLRLTAFAVNLSGVGSARPTTLQIVIERWSTDEERKKLVDTLVEKGSDALLDAVQNVKPRAGFIRTNTSLGWDISYARQEALPGGGTRITFATDRPIGFAEARNNSRSSDYEFMLCEIRLGPDGKGQGKLAGGAKITYKKEDKTIEIENYGQEPVRLTSVTIDK